jgi:hypothetical protein
MSDMRETKNADAIEGRARYHCATEKTVVQSVDNWHASCNRSRSKTKALVGLSLACGLLAAVLVVWIAAVAGSRPCNRVSYSLLDLYNQTFYCPNLHVLGEGGPPIIPLSRTKLSSP